MYCIIGGTRWRSWLRHSAKSRKVEGSISYFSLIHSYRPPYGPVVDSVSNRNKYQEYFLGVEGGRCLGQTILPPSCADCLEIWEPQTPGNLRVCPGLYRNCFTLILYYIISYYSHLTLLHLSAYVCHFQEESSTKENP